jgi:LPXTG-motif cell wall-anchored protein
MSECALEDRSARGYCPGDEEGAEEIAHLEEVVITTTTVAEPPPLTELPYTGMEPALAALGGLALLAGAVLLRLKSLHLGSEHSNH